jgi:MYXO-CTERM domain-containing protein
MILARKAAVAFLLLTLMQAHASLSDGLVAYFPFDGNANDSSGNGNHGTAVGGVTFEVGVFNSAARFDGSTGYIFANSSVGNLGSDATIAFWFKPTNAAFENSARIFEKDNRAYWVFLASSTGLSVALRGINSYGDPQTLVTVGSPGQFTLGWSQITMRKSGATMDIFINGSLASSVTTPVTSITTDAPLYFGKSYYWDTAYYAGLLDDARIYNRALSNDEIGQLSLVSEPTSAAFALSGAALIALLRRRTRLTEA